MIQIGLDWSCAVPCNTDNKVNELDTVYRAAKKADTPNPEPHQGLSSKVEEEPFWLRTFHQVQPNSRSAQRGAHPFYELKAFVFRETRVKVMQTREHLRCGMQQGDSMSLIIFCFSFWGIRVLQILQESLPELGEMQEQEEYLHFKDPMELISWEEL